MVTNLIKTWCNSRKWALGLCSGSQNFQPSTLSLFWSPVWKLKTASFVATLHLQKCIGFGIYCVALGYVHHLLLHWLGNRKVNFELCEYPIAAQTLPEKEIWVQICAWITASPWEKKPKRNKTPLYMQHPPRHPWWYLNNYSRCYKNSKKCICRSVWPA